MNANEDQSSERGREADAPSKIPKTGWKDILLRVKDEQGKDNLSIVSAGVAFYALFSIFPAITAFVSLYGLVADPAQVQQQVASFKGIVPQQVYQIISSQISSIVSSSSGKLGISLGVSIVLALWSAAKGMKAMITALDIAYDEQENRGIIRFNAVSLLLTLGAILFMIVSLALIVVLPGLLGNLGLPSPLQLLISIARWVLLAAFIMVGLGVLYRFAPDRDYPQWRWASGGAILATVAWIIASVLFSIYVSNFGSYNATYGSMGAVIVLLTWLFLTSYLILLGAELNAEMEHQTRKDTTRGEPRPMGSRGAHAADTMGEAR